MQMLATLASLLVASPAESALSLPSLIEKAKELIAMYQAEPPGPRQSYPSTYLYLDAMRAASNCSGGYCVPIPSFKSGDGTPLGSYFGSIDNGGSSTPPGNGLLPCEDVLPPGTPKALIDRFSIAGASKILLPNQKHRICSELAADGQCEMESSQNGTYCALTCGMCGEANGRLEEPVYVDPALGVYSGPNQLTGPDGLYNGVRFLPKLPRVPCEPYDPAEVAQYIREWAATDPAMLDLAKMVRIGFHDAADYNKWTGDGGPDGNILTGQETSYGQSHNLVFFTKALYQPIKKAFSHLSMSWADLLQIGSMAAVEIAGGPTFEEFDFQPGRIDNPGWSSMDGLLPNAGEIATMNTNRDFWFRAGFDDYDIVTSMGGHTLGGAFDGDFTPNPNTFSNDYYQLLLEYEQPGGGRKIVGPGLVQLSTDRALLTDPKVRGLVEQYAQNKTLFFKNYVKVIKRMSELGKDTSVQWCDYEAWAAAGGKNSSASGGSKKGKDGGSKKGKDGGSKQGKDGGSKKGKDGGSKNGKKGKDGKGRLRG